MIVFYAGSGSWCLEGDNGERIKMYNDYESGLFKLPNEYLKELKYTGKCNAHKLLGFNHQDGVGDESSYDFFDLNEDRIFTTKDLISNTKLNSTKRPNKKAHGNTIANRRKHAEVITAAEYIIDNYPNECSTKSSTKKQPAKISKLIYDNSYKFWPDRNDPPLSQRVMATIISEWLKQKTTK